jgi:hypothetical protein
MKTPLKLVVLMCPVLLASCQRDTRSLQSAERTDPCVKSSQRIDTGYSRQLAYVSGDPDLNRLQDFLSAALEANRKEFAAQQMIKGFGAGSSYPQIWLRDSATIIPLSRYYYSADYLTSWLEEHLSYQKADGQLYDWIAAGEKSNFLGAAPRVTEVYHSRQDGGIQKRITISADKNTTEADQEPAAIDAAYQVFKITGDRNWLNKNIKGRPLIDRLNFALNYLWKNKLESKLGLISNAFTADWGDVSPVYPDQRAIYLDRETPLVAGIYTNAIFYRAATQLAELNHENANDKMADSWKTKAAAIKENINKHLWQEDKGFYRIHLTLTPELLSNEDEQDDSDILAMGGNGLAVLNDIADDRQVRKIFDNVGLRKQQYGLSTIAGTLLPAYPSGRFKHPSVREEYIYQNGGQWDWFGGRFLLAEFERGYSRRAFRDLIEIARKSTDNHGLYEWQTRSGEGKGSANYAGSAGVLGRDVFQGLFGIYLSRSTLSLRIRLGDQSGRVHLYEPATDHYVAYNYCQSAGAIRLNYESNVPGLGQLHLLLPPNQRAAEAQVDGRNIEFRIETIGEDFYLVLDSDWKAHELLVKLSS